MIVVANTSSGIRKSAGESWIYVQLHVLRICVRECNVL